MLRLLKGVQKARSEFRSAIFPGGGDGASSGQRRQREFDANFERKLDALKQAGDQRLRDVFAAPLANILGVGYVPPVYGKTKEEYEFLESALADTFVFMQLKKHERKALLAAFESVSVKKGTVIYKENDVSEYCYVIQSGTVVFEATGVEEIKTATDGGRFGEVALLYDSPRNETCTAETDCTFWRLDQHTFRNILATLKLKETHEIKDLLANVPLLREVDEKLLARIAVALTTKTYAEEEEIIHKGDEVESLFIIKEGRIKATDVVVGESKYDDIEMGPGDSFGEAIMVGQNVLANVKAIEPVTMLCLSKQIFLKLFGDLQDMIAKSADMKKLKALPLAGKPALADYEIEALTYHIKDLSVKKGHIFTQEGTITTPMLYFVRSGKVSVSSTLQQVVENLKGLFGYKRVDTGAEISQGGYFGADTLKEPEDKVMSTYTIKAEEDTVVGVLTMDAIWSVIGRRTELGEDALSNLEKHKLLGAGTFGRVFLVNRKGEKEAFALKIQSKRKMIDYGQVEGVINERNIMARLDHPLIIKLVSSFQDDPNVYLLQKLYQGGELRSLIYPTKHGAMPEQAAAFYAAGILVGLSFMHQRQTLHRDLKPENVLLDNNGYPVLIDLGFAKVIRGETHTFCGTPMYLAPEVLTQRGYDKSYDLWSWGVMVYESIVGFTPFYTDPHMSEMQLYKRICKAEYDFPGGDFMTGEAKNLIRQMLVVDPIERLGCLAGGHDDIKAHPFFRDLDFDKIERKEIKAPWIPTVKNPLDGGNFRDWEDEEEEEEEPLSAKEQRYFKDF